jgi:hypothetical protein
MGELDPSDKGSRGTKDETARPNGGYPFIYISPQTTVKRNWMIA